MSTPTTMPETPAEPTTTVAAPTCGPNEISFDGVSCTVIVCEQDGMIFFNGPCPPPLNAAAETTTTTTTVAVVAGRPSLPTTGAGETVAVGAAGVVLCAVGAVAIAVARRRGARA